MDLLHTCYQSYMRLYPDDPDRLTLGRWVWCPEGAEYLPFDHAFQSSKWDPDSWRVDPDIGEVRGLVGYSSGKITPRFTGRNFCGAVILYQEGSPLDLMGTPAVDADGVPVCCDAPPAVGGLAMGGGGIVTSWADALLWLRPESLAELSDNDPISAWPDSAPGGDALTAGTPPPVRETYAQTGLPVAGFPPGAVLSRPLSLQLGSDYTIYLVGAASTFPGDGRAGPWLIGGPIGTRIFRVVDTGVEFSVSGYALSAIYPQSPVGWHLYALRADPASAEISVDAAALAIGTPGPVGGALLTGVSTSVITIPLTRACFVGEVLVFGTKLGDVQHAQVLSYLSAKWAIPIGGDDVIPGTVLAYAGSSLPSGYLACDGSDVSRITFAALFSAIGTTWGAGDGSTTFTLPDLRGRAGIGAGTGSGLSPRTLADQGGEEEHTLIVHEIPAHSHPISDPGHNHTLPSSGSVATVDNASPFLNVPDTSTGTSGNSLTNLSVGNTGDDGAHNNMQPFAVLQYLIKT